MDVEHMMYQTCPYDDEEGILIVDVETESIAETDEDGDLQYYCVAGNHTFSLDEDDTESSW